MTSNIGIGRIGIAGLPERSVVMTIIEADRLNLGGRALTGQRFRIIADFYLLPVFRRFPVILLHYNYLKDELILGVCSS
jgi:hypothetical protein